MLLWLTAIILKCRVKAWRIISGGLIGSMILIMSMFPYVRDLAGNVFVKLFFSILMTLTVFGFRRFRFFLSCLCTFYFVTFLTGGILIGSHYFLHFDFRLQSAAFLANVKGYGDPITWLFVVFSFPIAWYFSKQRIETIETNKVQYDVLVEVSMNIQGLQFSMCGLIDSGNQLYDPISKTPVMVVSILKFKDQLPQKIVQMANDPEKTFDLALELPMEWKQQIRFLPAQVIGKKHQLLPAFKPDFIEIRKGKSQWNVKKALVVFSNQALSSDDKFQCIVHPKMVLGFSVHAAS